MAMGINNSIIITNNIIFINVIYLKKNSIGTNCNVMCVNYVSVC